jgi:hypothetical protein
MNTYLRIAVEGIICWGGIFGILFVMNEGKAVFPATLVVVLLLIAAVVRKATISTVIKQASLRLVVLGSAFLLLFAIEPILRSWRENVYIIPVVIAAVVLVVTLNQVIRDRTRSRAKEAKIGD